MVHLHGQDIGYIAGDALVDRYDTSGFRAIGRGKPALFFGGGGGGGSSGPSPEELQQQQFAAAKDAEYNKTFNQVAKPWLNRVKKDTFNETERAAIAGARGNADIEQQATQSQKQGLQAALANGGDLSHPAMFTQANQALADQKAGMLTAAQKTGAESRFQDQADAMRLGTDTLGMTSQGLSALTSFGTDKQVEKIAAAGDNEAGKWNAINTGLGLLGQAYQGSVAEDGRRKYEAEQKNQLAPGAQGPVPQASYERTFGGKVNDALTSGVDKVKGGLHTAFSAWGFGNG